MSVLAISPFSNDHVALQSIFIHSRWVMRSACSVAQGVGLLRESPVSVVVCEHDLPDGSWEQILDECQRMENPPRVIVTSRAADERVWAEVLNLGGYDVLAKPFRPMEVFRSISLAWRNWHSNRKAAALA